MTGMPIVVVAGVQPLADALAATGQFPEVISANSVSELLAVVTSPRVSRHGVDELMFVFGDTVVADDPVLTLSEVLRKLTGAGYQAIVVTVTPKGAELQRQNPQAGLLALPLYVNDVLYAIGTFGCPVNPVDDDFGPLDLSSLSGRPAGRPASEQPWSPAIDVDSAPTWAPPAQESLPDAPAVVPTSPAAPDVPAVMSGWQVPVVDVPAADGSAFQPPATPATAPSPVAVAAPSPERAVLATPWTAPAEAPAWSAPADTAWSAPEEDVAWTAPAAAAAWPPAGPSAPMHLAPTAPVAGTPPAWSPPAQEGSSPAWAVARPTLGGAPQYQPASQPDQSQPLAARTDGYDARPAMQKRRGMVITIAVSKGGVGKSSMTLNLAAFLGMRLRSQGKTVAVIDANYQQADSGKYLDTYTPNINTILNNPTLMSSQRISEALVHKPEYNLSVLLGPATPDEGNPLALGPRIYNEILDLMKEQYDYIFIDTPVAEKYHEMFNKFALIRADYVIVPVAPNFQTLHNADNWLRAAVIAPHHAQGAGMDPNRVGIVLNRAEEGIGCSEDDVRQTMASWHFLGAIPETKEWKAANNRNELVAPKNYAELSQAFAEVLHAATGEPVLLENLGLVADTGGGVMGTLKGIFRRNR